jgi:hypothetical protein
MAFSKKHGGHISSLSGQCGSQFPTNRNVAGGHNVQRYNQRCAGGYNDRTEKENIDAQMRSSSVTTRVSRKDSFSLGGTSITQDGKIRASEINTLLGKIKAELSSQGRGGHSGLPGSISGSVLKRDFQAMADSVANEAGGGAINFSGRDGIYSADVITLINRYNTLTNDCICNSDCGTNQTCSCHNNCGCHY